MPTLTAVPVPIKAASGRLTDLYKDPHGFPEIEYNCLVEEFGDEFKNEGMEFLENYDYWKKNERLPVFFNCIANESILGTMMGYIFPAGAISSVSEETSSCIQTELGDFDLQSTAIGIMMRQTEAWEVRKALELIAISCLNDEEWEIHYETFPLTPEQRSMLQCLTETFDGPMELSMAMRNNKTKMCSATKEQADTRTVADEIEKLGQLMEKGFLTQTEFDEEKRRVLNQ